MILPARNTFTMTTCYIQTDTDSNKKRRDYRNERVSNIVAARRGVFKDELERLFFTVLSEL